MMTNVLSLKSYALSETKVHWRKFFTSLKKHEVGITDDIHAQLNTAKQGLKKSEPPQAEEKPKGFFAFWLSRGSSAKNVNLHLCAY